MKYFSMFSGIGGFELGIQKASYNMSLLAEAECNKTFSTEESESRGARPSVQNRWPDILFGQSQHDGNTDCVGFSEIDKYAIKIYESHFGGHKNYGDATKIDPGELPDFDMLCGGFPCQAFSIAGSRRGFNDTRGTLFFEIARILEVKRPKVVFLENVKGLLNHDKGKTFRVIIQSLDELGYDVQWVVLNSKNFGVPQNRERVFIVGSLRGGSRPEILPFGGSDEESHAELQELTQNTSDAQRCYNISGIAKTLKGEGGGQGAKTGLYANCLDSNYYKGNSASSDRHTPRTVIPVLTPDRPVKRQNGRRFKEDGEPSFTVTSQDRHGVAMPEESQMRIRRLTPTECERLQGFPDGWTEGVSDTQRYKCLGNAVTVNVIEAVAEKILNGSHL